MTDLLQDEYDGNLRPLLPSHDDEPMPIQQPPSLSPSLPRPLRVLYGLNGFTLSLPSMALLYIVNTRASVPVAFLSAYGAVAFLPFSLKPFYAFVSDRYQGTRDSLLVVLLVLSGVSAAATAFSPPGGVGWCFLLAFARGVTSAWPEFLLELALIGHARHTQGFTYEAASALFQSEAATSRNFGSFLANLVAFLLFAQIHSTKHRGAGHTTELNDTTVTILLLATGLLNLVGAMVAYSFQIGKNSAKEPSHHTTWPCWQTPIGGGCISRQNSDSYEPLQDFAETGETLALPSQSSHSSFRGNCIIIGVFQLAIIMFAMRGPITTFMSNLAWIATMLSLVIALLLAIRWNPIMWKRTHCVGLFLMMRHAIPKATYLVESYVYTLFQSTPILFQSLSIMSMGMTTLSSWSYGKVLARYSHGGQLLIVIVGTTVASSLLSLGDLLVVKLPIDDHVEYKSFMLVILVQTITTFAGEWQFLPNVVLATSSVVVDGDEDPVEQSLSSDTNHNDLPRHGQDNDCQSSCDVDLPYHDQDTRLPADKERKCKATTDDTTGMQYGTLMSCIDFGDQIGSWVTVPLVSALGISRDNGWEHLDTMVVITSLLVFLSAGLVVILRHPSP